MASAWRKKNERGRRMVALENLKTAKFFPKGDRTEEKWEEKRQQQIEILEKKIR
tara:strand:+ start:365 stop:526 length:162 start_codon:yes stop_codon:yes gene_type:complete